MMRLAIVAAVLTAVGLGIGAAPTSAAGPSAFVAGEEVEALSAKGWQTATIVEVVGGEALVHYQASGLPDERLDLALIRTPKAAAGVKPGAEIRQGSPATSSGAVKSGNPAKGGGVTANGSKTVAPGLYVCGSDNGGFTVTTRNDRTNPISVSTRLTVEINDGATYTAFGDHPQPYSYEPATRTITWQGGLLAGMGGAAAYQAVAGSPPSIVLQFSDAKLTCTRE
jgi:hypothetical protein